jgi:hypothetical protein
MRRTMLRWVICWVAALAPAHGPLRAAAPGSSGLHPKVPPADPRKYRGVRDAKDWANPYLVIRPDGVEIVSKSLPRGRKLVPAGQLRRALVHLPVAAWPYGRVVALQEAGIRTANDRGLIHRNKAQAQQVLKSLRVKADWWPSG